MQGYCSKLRKERERAFLKLMPDVSYLRSRNEQGGISSLEHEREALLLSAGEINIDDDGASDTDVE